MNQLIETSLLNSPGNDRVGILFRIKDGAVPGIKYPASKSKDLHFAQPPRRISRTKLNNSKQSQKWRKSNSLEGGVDHLLTRLNPLLGTEF